jgi:hypothetical protein
LRWDIWRVGNILASAALLVSVLAIPITFALGRRTRQRPEFRYAIDFDVILKADNNLFDRGLFMTLGTHRIDSISRSRVAIWNHRGDTIRKSDNLDSDPLRLQLEEDDEALQIRILGTSRLQAGIVVELHREDLKSVPIDFDFLDAGDGAIIELIHKGPSRPTLVGTLQGVNIRSIRSPDLDMEALRGTSAKLRGDSFKERLMMKLRRPVLSWVTPLTFLAFAVLLIISLIHFPQASRGYLIHSANYNLQVISGQIAFAKAVANTPAYYASSTRLVLIAATAATLTIAFVTAGFLYSIHRKKIPQSIFELCESDG